MGREGVRYACGHLSFSGGMAALFSQRAEISGAVYGISDLDGSHELEVFRRFRGGKAERRVLCGGHAGILFRGGDGRQIRAPEFRVVHDVGDAAHMGYLCRQAGSDYRFLQTWQMAGPEGHFWMDAPGAASVQRTILHQPRSVHYLEAAKSFLRR